MARYVILDRDGVINHDSPDYIKNANEWIPIPGSLEAIATLAKHGIDVYVATNQAGVARGKLSLGDLNGIHKKLLAAVSSAGGVIQDLKYCPHHPDENCDCRKPKPGLILQLADAHALDLSEGYYVGDSLKDLRAAEAAGCEGVLVLTGNGKETLNLRPNHPLVFNDLFSFATFLTKPA